MELNRALELAVISAWDELVRAEELPSELCAVHVEYKNACGRPLTSVEVWTISDRGYGTLAFRHASPQSDSSTSRLKDPTMRFGNSYRSVTLASNFDFIMRNQGKFTRPRDKSIYGAVQIESPNEGDRKTAAEWKQSITTKA